MLQIKNILLGFSVTVLLWVAFIGCDSLLPDDFDSDKTFNPASVDSKAGNILSRDTTGFSANPGNFLVIGARPLTDIVDSLTALRLEEDSVTEDEVIRLQFNTLADSLQNLSLLRDSLMFIQFENTLGIDTVSGSAYALLNITASQPKDFYLYTSLIYTEDNINEHIAVQLIKPDGSFLTYNNDMTMETVTCNTQTIQVAGGTRLVPTIKARYRIHADEGTYIVRFTKSTLVDFGHLFKILILSI